MPLLSRAVFALLMGAVLAGPVCGQEGIPIPRFVPPPAPRFVPPRIPVYPVQPVSGRSDQQGGSHPADPTVLIVILAGIGAVVGLLFFIAAWKGRTVAHLRIVRTPPGEAPEEIRRAWVGVQLPLRSGETSPGLHLTEGVLSQQTRGMTTGYAVDGRAAVAALASHSPEAAAWWRKNAPHVVERGYRLWFPSEVCERVERPNA